MPGFAFSTMERELSAIIRRTVDLNMPELLSLLHRDKLIAQAESQYVAP